MSAREIPDGGGLDFLIDGGDMGALMRATDWASTPLGPAEAWPQSLKTAVGICLTSRFPIVLWWGSELRLLYNDAWRPALGALKHPALAKPGKEVWPEIWHLIGPMLEGVLARGEATWSRDMLLAMDRHGFLEESYWTYSYSPIRVECGGVGGVFTAAQETTERVLGERRLKTLKALAATATAGSVAAACEAAIAALAPADVPFALMYLLTPDGSAATLCAATEGLPEACRAERIELGRRDRGWPLGQVVRAGEAAVVEELSRRFGRMPSGSWPNPPERAIVLPLRAAAGEKLSGVLVAGVSAGLPWNDDYRSFFALVAGHIATAISNARAHEEERRRAAALAELDRAKTAFFSNVSHEFRTPLTLMLGPLEDLLQGEGPPAARELLATMHRNGQRLLKLVNALLDFSRIEAGRVQANFEPTDLAGFTAELASVFRSAIEKAGLRLVIACEPLPQPAYVDRDMWEKIVLNLVSNAFKYTFEGEIRVGLRAEAGRAVLTVGDTGTGIPAHELPHVFERFHRVEGAKGRTVEGSGIGLALVHELVKLHGGAVAVDSAPDEGSTFTVAVPLGRGHLPARQIAETSAAAVRGAAPFVAEALRWLPDAPREEPPTPSISGERPTIVLADDNADMREYVRRLLAPRYAVVAAADGQAALAAVRERAPALVLTDVMMPELDGFALLRELRSDPRTASTPVVMLSARAGEEARVEGLRAGADDYLIKPFSARELLARVEATLALAKARREAVELRAETTGVLESIGEGYLAIDREWRLTYVNAAAERELGMRREEMLGRDHWEVFPGTIGTQIERAYRQVAAERVPIRFENYYEPWQRWFELATYPGREGGLVVYFRDVTQRKADEQRLRRDNERLQLLSETARHLLDARRPDALVRGVFERVREHLQADAYFHFVVDAAGDGLDLASCAGVPDEAARSLGHLGFGQSICGAVAREEVPIELRSVQQSEDPRAAPIKALGIRTYYCSPLKAGERLLGTLSFASRSRDAFAADELEFMRTLCHYASAACERVRLIDELRAEDRKKDEFLAMLAHELRNPLAPLRNGLEVLRLAGADASASARARAMMERQVGHLVRLIDDLLDVSRISQSRLTLQRKRLALAEVAASAIETARPLIDAAGHALAVTLPDEPVALDGDLTRLAQVFSNLLTNAAKYTPRGGTIRLIARRVGEEVTVAVHDTGIGIPREALPQIFDMFNQVDRSIERTTGGLGIGLALVRGLVEMHGGTVTADSAGPGAGSTFTVRLPALPAEPIGPTAPPEVVEAPQRRVLVVDDNRDAAESTAMMLSLLGSEVRTAHDGIEAIEAAEAFRPQLILMDVGMPRLNGLDATRRIRALAWGRGITIVALTGWGQDADRQRSREAGCDGHLVKPVELRDLEKLLASVTEGR